MTRRRPSSQPNDSSKVSPRDLDRARALVERARGDASTPPRRARRGASPLSGADFEAWQVHVELMLLDAIHEAFLRAMGMPSWARRSSELLGLASRASAGSGLPLGAGSPSRVALVAELAEVPWLEWGAAGLEELVRGFGVERQRSELGKFYTPTTFVEHLLDHTLGRALTSIPIDRIRVLEPACGSGDFAVPLLERLTQAWTAAGKAPREARRLALERNLFAVDRDPVAVVVTRMRLLARSIDSYRDGKDTPVQHVLQENALWDAVEPPSLDPVSMELPFGDRPPSGAPPRLDDGGGLIASRSPFHVVVGNPPYGGRLSAPEKHWLQQRYRLARGRIETAALFVERSLEVLAPGGYLGLVLPLSFTRSGAYANARRMLNERLRLTTLADLGDAFPGISFNTMLVTGTSGRARPTVELFEVRDGRMARTAKVPRSFLRGRSALSLRVATEDVGFYQELESRATPLRDLVNNERGLNLKNRRARMVHGTSGGVVPVVQGRDLKRFVSLELSELPRVDDSVAALGLLTEPAVAIQNVSNVIEATLIPAGTLPLDTVNVLSVRGDQLDPAYLIALLNSTVIGAYLDDLVINHATLTVHLDDPTLGGLPILVGMQPRLEREIVARVRRLLELEATTARAPERERLVAEVDEMVNRIYAVTPERARRFEARRAPAGRLERRPARD